MKTLTYQLRDLKKFMICIGFEDENNRTQVRIDCGEVYSEYPNAAVSMKVQAPKGGIYPATVTREGNMILWTVRDCDVANKGSGEFQLTFTDGTTVIKTCVGRFHVDRSLKGSGTAPSGVQDWLENAEKVLEQVESAEIHQPMIGLDGYWYKWDQEEQQYVSTGTKAQGHTPVKGTDYWTAEDKADMVSDTAAELINDNSTELNKTWSAEKLQAVKSAITSDETYIKANQSILAQSGICVNLINPNAIENNMAIRTTNGTTYANTGTAVTDFIPVQSGKKYSFFRLDNGQVKLSTANRVIGFTSAKAFSSSIGEINSSNKTITIPTGVAYIRLQYTSSAYSTPSNLMVCEVADETVPSTFSVFGETNFNIDNYATKAELSQTNATLNSTIYDLEEVTDILDIDYNTLTGTLITGKFIEADGSIADIASYQVLKVDVIPFEEYYVTAEAYSGKYYFIFYDENNTVIGNSGIKAQTTSIITNYKVTAPANAAYIYVDSTINHNVQEVKTFNHYEIPAVAKKWVNKKWTVVGDSITQVNEATTKHYYEYIQDESGINVANMGVGGTGYVRGYNSSNAFYQRISSVPTDSDIVTIFGSGNDCNIEAMAKFDGMTWAQALGTYTDATTDTICGCINATLDAYFAIMVTAPIGIIAPTPWKSYPTTKLTNNRFEDYTSKLKQIAEYRGVPFLDLYHGSNLRPENEANCNACFYNSSNLDGNGDGVHPNALGHSIIASKIFEFVKTLLLN